MKTILFKTKCVKEETAVRRFNKKYNCNFKLSSLRENGYEMEITMNEHTVTAHLYTIYDWDASVWMLEYEENTNTEQIKEYIERDAQTVNTLLEDSLNFSYQIIEFDEIESKRLKLKERSGYTRNYEWYNTNRYITPYGNSCGYIYDGRAREYEKEEARIIKFNRNINFSDIRNLQYDNTLAVDDFYLGVTIHITPEKNRTHISILNADGTQACEHVFKNVIECKKWYYHLESVWSIEHGYMPDTRANN